MTSQPAAEVEPREPARRDGPRRDIFQVGAAASAGRERDAHVAVSLQGVSAWYGSKLAISGVTFEVQAHSVTALIGPSGCGKSTVLRCINRMHEISAGARVEGVVRLDGADVYGSNVDPTRVRQRIGMVFQKPNPFPTMTVAQNVAAGLKFMNVHSKSEIRDRVQEALKAAALWDEVKNGLDKPGMALSGGQQQRLCIARTIAVEPEVVLMDEPCSALDPIATLKIEDLMADLAQRYTIVIVTHNLQQAARVADHTGFMLVEPSDGAGHLIEYSPTADLFTQPQDKRTEDFITGRFG